MLFASTIEFLLFGFGIYSLFQLTIKPLLSEFKRLALNGYDQSACLIAAFFGALYLLFWLIALLSEREMSLIDDRYHGPYWYGVLTQPFLFSITQLLWFKSLRTKGIIRFIIALFLMISIDDIVIMVTSLHRDYLPSSWSIPISLGISEGLLSLGAFGIASTIFHAIRTKRN